MVTGKQAIARGDEAAVISAGTNAMSALDAYGSALGFGVVAGMRTATAPAMLSRAATSGRIALHHGGIAGMLASPWVARAFSASAIGEDILDKSSRIPSRLSFPAVCGRLAAGAICGVAICTGDGKPALVGGMLGVLGAYVGAFSGNRLRGYAVRSTGAPDFVFALLEDVGAVAAATAVLRAPRNGIVIAVAASAVSLALRNQAHADPT